MKKVIILFFVLIIFSCEFVETHKLERSYSIKESKEKGVFISEYFPDKRKVILNDTINFEFEEIWMEYPWWYINQEKDIEIIDSTNGTVFFKFKNQTDLSIRSKGVEILSTDIPYSGFNNICYELDNINLKKNMVNLKIVFYNNSNEKNWIKIDSTNVQIKKYSPDGADM
ncbi:MAG TPA: hypothetical protein VF677_07805 [Flavobacterium sp.]|jgi:hypothetical protein